MSDEHPVRDPGDAPTWLALPTMPWTRVVPGQREEPDPGELTEEAQLRGWFESRTRSKQEQSGKDDEPTQQDLAPPPGQAGGHPGWPPAAMDATSVLPIVVPRQGRPAGRPSAPARPQQPTRPADGGQRRTGTAAVVSQGVPVRPAPPNARPVSGPPVSGPPVSGPPATVDLPAYTGPDPEQLLAAYRWRFDPDTLREVIDDDEATDLRRIRDLLSQKIESVSDDPTRARLLSLRAVISRTLDDLPKALADGKLALAHAEATGELRRIAIAQARLAHVLQWNSEYEEADRLFALANSTELPDRLRATMYQHAGRCAYEQGRYIEACTHFERAVELRRDEDPDLIEETALALDAVFRRVAERGWGPYPRTREAILQIVKPPVPAFDARSQLWGYVDAAAAEPATSRAGFGASGRGGPSRPAEFVIGPRYVDVQPFRDGAAWVQRRGVETWGLIDEHGEFLIDPAAGYLGVSSFSDGLAWVSRDGGTRWIAIDKANEVMIPVGFDDVRPFRRGLAPVRRDGRWGAVDAVGRVVVALRFDGFATALHDGRYIDGFSDEGLAVVALGRRKGVVDRSGRVVVAPTYPMLVIHPVAYLVADDRQRWGALDRRGRPLIDLGFPSRVLVVEELDNLLADTRPML